MKLIMSHMLSSETDMLVLSLQGPVKEGIII